MEDNKQTPNPYLQNRVRFCTNCTCFKGTNSKQMLCGWHRSVFWVAGAVLRFMWCANPDPRGYRVTKDPSVTAKGNVERLARTSDTDKAESWRSTVAHWWMCTHIQYSTHTSIDVCLADLPRSACAIKLQGLRLRLTAEWEARTLQSSDTHESTLSITNIQGQSRMKRKPVGPGTTTSRRHHHN